jgi:hypothetical protein
MCQALRYILEKVHMGAGSWIVNAVCGAICVSVLVCNSRVMYKNKQLKCKFMSHFSGFSSWKIFLAVPLPRDTRERSE